MPVIVMKTTSLIFALIISFAAASVALASDKAKDGKEAKPAVADTAKKTQPQSAQQESKAALTGSSIKRSIRRNGMITDGPSQLLVIDRGMIERSGASDVRQLLVHQGIH